MPGLSYAGVFFFEFVRLGSKFDEKLPGTWRIRSKKRGNANSVGFGIHPMEKSWECAIAFNHAEAYVALAIARRLLQTETCYSGWFVISMAHDATFEWLGEQ